MVGTDSFKFKEKKICIFTNYRTASSFLVSCIGSANNLPVLGEYFGLANAKHGIAQNNPKYDEMRRRTQNFDYDKAVKYVETMKSGVVKIMPDQLLCDKEKIAHVLGQFDKIIYWYRSDFNAQLLSFIAAYSKSHYDSSFLDEIYEIPNSKEFQRNQAINAPTEDVFNAKLLEKYQEYQEVKPEHYMPEVPEDFIKSCRDLLIKNYVILGDFYKTIHGDVGKLESLKMQMPYKHTINWEKVPEFEDFDVEALFTDGLD